MNAYYEKCEHCHQWINPIVNHYVVAKHGDKIIFLHKRPCETHYREEYPDTIIQSEHINQRR